ncbi:MAG: hypothetical protein ISR65_19405 [Bacteriovoracaceae bacterium]|nr:hypothetical protein [Bacteriovoracaceae bacterium]
MKNLLLILLFAGVTSVTFAKDRKSRCKFFSIVSTHPFLVRCKAMLVF